MRILLCHSYYQQRGGEDQCFEDEAQILADAGHEVIKYTKHNDEVKQLGVLRTAARTYWSRSSYHEIRQEIRQHRPEVVHFTNTHPLISPSGFYAARAEGIPVVLALHNFRHICAGTYLMRDGKVCEDCLGKMIPWPAVKHRCYRDSVAASGVVATMPKLHQLLRTWKKTVNAFFTPSQIAREKLLHLGMPPERISVKPNSVSPDPQVGAGQGNYAVFVARLSPEKGLQTLLDAWQQQPTLPPLKIIGEGPLAETARAAAEADPRIEWLGRLPLEQVLEVIGDAACLLMPSLWYETFGRTIVEAFAKGTPVIASRLGAMQELIEEGRTGFLFEPGNARDLIEKIEHHQGLDIPRRSAMRREARSKYVSHYTPEANYRCLMDIYERAKLDLQQRFKKTRGSQQKNKNAQQEYVGNIPVKVAMIDKPLNKT